MSKLNILIESNNEGIIEASELLKLGKLEERISEPRVPAPPTSRTRYFSKLNSL